MAFTLNITLLFQMLIFIFFVWFTTNYVWPPIINAMHKREKKIAAGLEAAQRSKIELEIALHEASTIIRTAKQNASHILEQAHIRAIHVIEKRKREAKKEGQRIFELERQKINIEMLATKQILKTQLAALAVASAEKILQRKIDGAKYQDMLSELAQKI